MKTAEAGAAAVYGQRTDVEDGPDRAMWKPLTTLIKWLWDGEVKFRDSENSSDINSSDSTWPCLPIQITTYGDKSYA